MNRIEGVPPLPAREPDTHKGSHGKNLLVAGSEGMAGAAILAARAAYRAGAGLVTVGIQRELFSTVSPAVPEAIFLDTGAWSRLITVENLSDYQAVLVGPGVGTERISQLLWWILENRHGPLVLDADALNLIAREAGKSLSRREDWIWTPHPGEFTRLTGRKACGEAERVEAAEEFVKARGGVLVLKGHGTVVMDGKRYAINRTGNPGMATAGSGDVLAGMVTAFLGQGLPAFEAARLAVHLHGLAGDLAARELGEIPLVATDLITYLPPAIARHSQEKNGWKKD